MNRGFALLLFMSGCAAAKKGKARLMHSMVIKKRGRNVTLPLLIKPHVLDSDAAWRAAKKICDGGVPRAARPILVFVHIFKSAGTTTRETLKQYSARREAASATATCRFVSAGRCGGGMARRRLTFSSFARLLRPRRRRLGSANALCTSGARVAVPRPDVDVVAGHLWFGTLPASRPAIYVTCLRDPVVLRVSGALYLRIRRYDALSLDEVAKDVVISGADNCCPGAEVDARRWPFRAGDGLREEGGQREALLCEFRQEAWRRGAHEPLRLVRQGLCRDQHFTTSGLSKLPHSIVDFRAGERRRRF
jgi:hypothetical protein